MLHVSFVLTCLIKGGISLQKTHLTKISEGTLNVIKCPSITLSVILEISNYMDAQAKKK